MSRGSINVILQEGHAHHRAGRHAEAEAKYRQALQMDPHHPEALHLLGILASDCNQDAVAADLIGHAIAINPNVPAYHNNRAMVLNRLGKLQEAIAHYHSVILLQPDKADAHFDLAITLQTTGRTEEAIAEFREAVRLDSNNANYHLSLGMSLLLIGNYKEGLVENEWRMWVTRWQELWKKDTRPMWDGLDPAGMMILLRAEQGLGDTIQFIRYVPMLANAGAHVIVACPLSLTKLLQRVRGISTLCTEEISPPYDAWLPLMSLPQRFGTTTESIPATVPYLSAPPQLVTEWRSRLGPPDGRLRVGLAWAGNPQHINDRNRSIPLQMLAPLARVQGVQYISLQKGLAENPIAPEGLELLDYTADLNDLADTAALIENLDLVICVDTVIAHLAGALGKPTWVLLPFLSDWRWMMNREDSLWYPTIRLFRQTSIGDWGSVIERVAGKLLAMKK